MTAAVIGVINEQLLRAIGVGVALLDVETLAFRFRNDVFEGWFDDAPEAPSLTEALPRLDIAAVRAGLAEGGRYATEQRVRRKRRTLVMALSFRRISVGGDALVVLECQNISRMHELELMIESYAGLLERTAREHQRQRERIETLLVGMAPRDVIDAAHARASGLSVSRRIERGGVLSLALEDISALVVRGDGGAFIAEIDVLYADFDRIVTAVGLERVRTTGDRYVCVAVAHEATPDPFGAVAGAATRLMRYLHGRNSDHPRPWRCRIGLGAGSLLLTTLGSQARLVDAVGPALESADALRRMCEPMEILIPSACAAALPATVPLAPPAGAAARTAGAQAIVADAAAWTWSIEF